MPFPQIPRKHRWEPAFTASDFRRYQSSRVGPLPKPPPNAVMVFGHRWSRYLNRKYRGAYDSRTGVYRAEPSVGVVLVDGPGAPFATIVVEELAALGVKAFVIVGIAGSLDRNIPAGSMVVCSKALRDEGTSHHYRSAARFARPDRLLTNSLKLSLERAGVPYVEGSTWTIDAPYRETGPEIRRYRKGGILTVEMEAAAVFTVTQVLGRKSAALFVVSDFLDENGWEPRFHDTRSPLRRALQLAIRACKN